jgi:hypothetical protein
VLDVRTRLTTWLGTIALVAIAASPLLADYRTDRKLSLPSGGSLVLDSDVGAVTITGDGGSDPVLNITSRRDDFADRFDLHVDEQGRRVFVSIKRRGGWGERLFGEWFRDEDVRITIRVPQRTDVEARTAGGSMRVSTLDGNAILRTSGGSIRVADVGGYLRANTSGGSIQVDRVRGNVDAETSGGGITIADVSGDLIGKTSGGSVQIERVRGNVNAGTSGGGIRVRDAGGRVEAHTSGGSVNVVFARGNGRGGDLTTSGGGIQVSLDPRVALSLDAAASGGGVTANLPIDQGRSSPQSWPDRPGRQKQNELRADLRGGGPTVRIRTSGGGIQIDDAAGARR